MQIYSNAPAFAVWKDYVSNMDSMRKTLAKLSSGTQIHDAGYDPSGLAISERLRAQYRNTAMSAHNVENKINYLQTADAWLTKVHDILGRMAELSVMASDGTKSRVDRNNLQLEFRQMQKEIQRITSGATAAGRFNGLYLFRGFSGVPASSTDDGDGLDLGAGPQVRIQIGPDSDQVLVEDTLNLTATNFVAIGSYKSFTYGSVNMTVLASFHRQVTWASLICGQHLSVASQSLAQAAVDMLNIGVDYISNKRSVIGAEMKRLEHTLVGLRNYEENLRYTESRIRDTDVARESAAFARYQILTQLGTAMMTQANALPGGVAQLVG